MAELPSSGEMMKKFFNHKKMSKRDDYVEQMVGIGRMKEKKRRKKIEERIKKPLTLGDMIKKSDKGKIDKALNKKKIEVTDIINQPVKIDDIKIEKAAKKPITAPQDIDLDEDDFSEGD